MSHWLLEPVSLHKLYIIKRSLGCSKRERVLLTVFIAGALKINVSHIISFEDFIPDSVPLKPTGDTATTPHYTLELPNIFNFFLE